MIGLEFTVRESATADLPAIRMALAYALDWRAEGGWESPDALIEGSGHGYLLADWGRPGDTAVVAEISGRVVGAAWYRCWTDSLHSYGYIDEATPEVGLGVDPRCRRHGVGTALMTALFARATESGFAALSLSVERDNPAERLYRQLGFEHSGDVDNAWTMRKQLSSEQGCLRHCPTSTSSRTARRL